MDRIHIRDLTANCIIGVDPDERQMRQELTVNLCLECDLAAAGRSDELADTVDYRGLKNDLVGLIEASRFLLIERLADRVAARCLAAGGVRAVTVTVDKPGALTGARSVAVEIRRSRDKQARPRD